MERKPSSFAKHTLAVVKVQEGWEGGGGGFGGCGRLAGGGPRGPRVPRGGIQARQPVRFSQRPGNLW